MSEDHTLIPDLRNLIDTPEDGILSKPFVSDERLRVTIFGMSAGQEMTEHTAATDAIVQVLEGTIALTVQGVAYEAGPGAFLHMKPRVPHSLIAKTPAKFCLIIIRT